MKIIVGLGNPEKIYESTYHNIGFQAVDILANMCNIKFNKNYCSCEVAEAKVGDEKIVICKPQTYMNLSGEAVSKLQKRFKCSPEEILIILDDIDLEVGKFRYRLNGSGGTHNGLKNCVLNLGTENFPRLRIGIGRCEKSSLADYVLSVIPKSKQESIHNAIKEGLACVLKEFLDV